MIKVTVFFIACSARLQIDECNLQTESSLQTNESLQTRSADKILSADEARLQIDECNCRQNPVCTVASDPPLTHPGWNDGRNKETDADMEL